MQGGITEGERRADTAVGTSEVVHKPSDVEVALRCLASRLRGLRGLSSSAGAVLCACTSFAASFINTS